MKTKATMVAAAATAREGKRLSRERRAKQAEEFRAALVKELNALHGAPVTLSATTQALLDSAVSARLEITRAAELFIKGYANAGAMQRSGLARSELRRSLRSLGLIGDDARDDSATPSDGLTIEDLRGSSEAAR